MPLVLALTAETELFNQVESDLGNRTDAEMYAFEDTLDFIDHFLHRYAQIVILDIDLLQRDVLKLIDILKSIHKEARIILILSEEQMAVCSAALAQGVVSYQIKPLSRENVVDVIASALKIPNHSN